MAYQSFKQKKTKSGFNADEVVSALQKEIRRGNVESACYFGLELLESGLEFEQKFWKRMVVISVEDINDDSVIPIIKTLKDNYADLQHAKEWDKGMQGLRAIKILCEAKKGRIISELYDLLSLKRKEGFKLEIPDYALDMHTEAGRAKGRGVKHFLEVAAKVINTTEKIDDKISKEILKKVIN